MEERELLQYALEHGMIDMSYVQEQMEMNKREAFLRKHPYEIWEGKDGKKDRERLGADFADYTACIKI